MRRQLKVIADETSRNCFVKLPASIATQVGKLPPPVVLRLSEINGSAAPCYVSWGRETHNQGDAIMVSGELLRHLPHKPGDFVMAEVVPYVPKAHRVLVVPHTVDDSEIIELNQGEVENVATQQLLIVYPGLVFPLYVHGTLVRLRVTQVEPSESSRCVYLGEATEMIVETLRRIPAEPQAADEEPPEPSVVRCVAGENTALSAPTMFVPEPLLARLHWRIGSVVSAVSLTSLVKEPSEIENKRAQKLRVRGSAAAIRQARLFVVAKRDPGAGTDAVSFSPCPFRVASCVFVDPSPGAEGTTITYEAEFRDEQDLRRGFLGGEAFCGDYNLQSSGELPAGFAPLEDFLSVYPELTKQCVDAISAPICQREIFAGIGGEARSLHCGNSLLVTGPKGSGKTALATALARSTGLYAVYLPLLGCADPSLVPHSNPNDAFLRRLKRALLDCLLNAPAVLVIDDLHTVLPVDSQGHIPKLLQLCAAFLDLVRRLSPVTCSHGIFVDLAAGSTAAQYSGGVTVIATAPSVDALHPSIGRSSAFPLAITLPLPAPPQRTKILRLLSRRLYGLAVADSAAAHIGQMTHNYTPLDLQRLCTTVVRSRSSLTSEELTFDELKAAMAGFTPISYEGIQFLRPKQTLRDVGGMQEVVDLLKETLVLPSKYPQIFASLPTALRSGLLLYGPPGCGKTHVVASIVGDAGLNCLVVNGPEVLNKYIGASEMRVREVFTKAAAAKPCVIFFDEFDSIAPRRGHDSTGVTDRVVNQLLTMLDGVEDRSGVYVVAATSRPDLLDPALLRPGRLDKHVLCGPPTLEERLAVLRCVAEQCALESDVDLEEVAQWCEGFTFADLSGLISTAQLKAVHGVLDSIRTLAQPSAEGAAARDAEGSSTQEPFGEVVEGGILLNAQHCSAEVQSALRHQVAQLHARSLAPVLEANRDVSDEVRVSMAHLRAAFADSRRSLSPAELQRFMSLYARFRAGRERTAQSGEAMTEVGQRVSLA